MKITVRVFGDLKNAFGARELIRSVECGMRVSDVLKVLGTEYDSLASKPGWESQLQRARILLNGMDMHSSLGMDCQLNEGDVITILPAIAGG